MIHDLSVNVGAYNVLKGYSRAARPRIPSPLQHPPLLLPRRGLDSGPVQMVAPFAVVAFGTSAC